MRLSCALVLSDSSMVVSLTSNGGCRREEKSRKHWSLFTKFSFFVKFFLFVRVIQEQLYVLNALKIREKLG